MTNGINIFSTLKEKCDNAIVLPILKCVSFIKKKN